MAPPNYIKLFEGVLCQLAIIYIEHIVPLCFAANNLLIRLRPRRSLVKRHWLRNNDS
jgi:hypothetical protein